MSNFKCPVCHMVNIDCGQDGYKTDKEIKLEKEIDKLKKSLRRIKEIAEERDYLSLDECLDDILIEINEVEE